MMKFHTWVMLIGLLCSCLAASAENPAHEELRILRSEIIGAITRGDIDSVIKHVHPDLVVTRQNSEVCRGTTGLLELFERMGKNSFRSYKLPPTPDELTIFHGDDTGISFGETVGEFNLFGAKYEIKSRWTATVVKQDGRWLLAAYHISMNALDNPLLDSAKNGIYFAGGVALLIGILIGQKLVSRKV